MAVTENFKSKVKEGNVRSIRIMMKDSLLIDPTFEDFNKMEILARNVPGLYDVHDGQELIEDRTVWNDDYMNKLMVQVVGNFSHERIAHLKEVVKYLRPEAAVHKKQVEQTPGSRSVKIAGGAVAGAVAGGVIAGAAGATVGVGLAVAAGCAVAGAVVVTAVTNSR